MRACFCFFSLLSVRPSACERVRVSVCVCVCVCARCLFVRTCISARQVCAHSCSSFRVYVCMGVLRQAWSCTLQFTIQFRHMTPHIRSSRKFEGKFDSLSLNSSLVLRASWPNMFKSTFALCLRKMSQNLLVPGLGDSLHGYKFPTCF